MTLATALACMPDNNDTTRVYRSAWPTLRLRVDYIGLFLTSGVTTAPYPLTLDDLKADDWVYTFTSDEWQCTYFGAIK